MQEMISCLMPTYNRAPNRLWLIEEAIMGFLLQDYPQKELLVLNDTPEQMLECDLPGVKIINSHERFPDLSAKLQFMVDHAEGNVFCRMDDDDISLPWRLSLSLHKLGDGKEWRAENHWYANGTSPWTVTNNPANTHVMAIWRRELLDEMGGYPPKWSGIEDIRFNQKLVELGYPQKGGLLALEDIFYIYRWGVSDRHLSGVSNPSPEMLQAHYDTIGKKPRASGVFRLKPHWGRNYHRHAVECAVRLLSAKREGECEAPLRNVG